MPNKFTLVLIFLGASLLINSTGVIILAVLEKNIPGILENLAVAALAGLSGMLAKDNETPQAVTVTNTVAEAVPTEDVEAPKKKR